MSTKAKKLLTKVVESLVYGKSDDAVKYLNQALAVKSRKIVEMYCGMEDEEEISFEDEESLEDGIENDDADTLPGDEEGDDLDLPGDEMGDEEDPDTELSDEDDSVEDDHEGCEVHVIDIPCDDLDDIDLSDILDMTDDGDATIAVLRKSKAPTDADEPVDGDEPAPEDMDSLEEPVKTESYKMKVKRRSSTKK